MLSACTPAPEPDPTPTAAFASEAEAFAAAEETYRAFTVALNEIDVSDPATFERLYALSSGSFEASDRETYSKMHAERYIVTGDTEVISFSGKSSAFPFESVVADLCIDVSAVEVTDSTGVSQVNPERPDVYALEVTFIMDSSHQLMIDSARKIEDESCASS
ncbi:MAG: hypothetical protein ACTH8F_00360 [Microbacterium sp.]|uniref:hypothetical protein n=1 Tax=Microbacterium sp. TaxID=51671 RepID=UPI003F9A22EF